MRNPYIDAAVRYHTHVREQAPVVHCKSECPSRIQEFFAAMEIGHPGNRAKVATAIAHTLTPAELDEGIRRLTADTTEYVNKLTELKAPAIIIANAGKKNTAAVRILERVRSKQV